jgi:hypothetical protein
MFRLLDIRTLCFGSGLADVSLAMAMTYVWRSRRTYPGFGGWVLSAWLGGLGTLLLGGRGLIPPFLSVVGANLGILSSTALLVTGLDAFEGRPSRLRGHLVLLAVAAGLVAFLVYAHPSFRLRVAAFSLATAGLCLQAAQAARRLPTVLGKGNSLLLATLGVLTAFHALRAVAVLAAPPPTEDFMAASTSQALSLLLFMVAQACIYAGLIVVNAQRVELDLQAALEECKVLRGILPICATCKKIRDEQGGWNQLEAYLQQHTEAAFTHGICPDCAAAFKTGERPLA